MATSHLEVVKQRWQPARNGTTFVFTVLASTAASILLHGCGGGSSLQAQPPSEAAHASEDAPNTKQHPMSTSVAAPRASALRVPADTATEDFPRASALQVPADTAMQEVRDSAGGVIIAHVPAGKPREDFSEGGKRASWFWNHGTTTLAPATHVPIPAPTPAPTPAPPAYCSDVQTDCRATKCCLDPNMRCYSKNEWWAECFNKSSCVPGIHPADPLKYRSNWTCTEISGPTPPPFHGWNYGTWTTGYWDCCKPSCAWPRKGNQSRPVRSCHARTGEWLRNASEVSVCDGGISASCTSHRPFVVNDGLSMGFAAAAVRGGAHHLTGDSNCGQCYELVFTDAQHQASKVRWGGASKGLVDKRMIVQVINIGEDVEGNHSFDLQIPGAGLGSRSEGCPAQFPGTDKDDFDCGVRFGGCNSIKGCDKLPKNLQSGCHWRYNWLEWLKNAGTTNNPFVRFRRVKCPLQLTDISGSVPYDDEDGWLIVM